MNCAWQELKAIFPPWIQCELDKPDAHLIQDIRLRLGANAEFVMGRKSRWLRGPVRKEDMNYIINTASRYSPWAAQSMASGYITAPGGHRIGICGETVIMEGYVTGIRRISSLCIRVARDFPGIAKEIADKSGSILVIGPPGSGKTTLLRDLLRLISEDTYVGVVDQRGELFLDHFQLGRRMDILTGCPKKQGVEMILRTMGPTCIGMDEITAKEDCEALLHGAWCGIRLIATAHAGSVKDFISRPVYRPLVESGIFDRVIVMDRDKRWREERVMP